MHKVIATTPLNGREEARVHIDHFKGKDLLHIRRWYAEDGAFKPGKGFSMPIDLLPWLRAQLEAAEAEAAQCGLLKAEDYMNQGLPVHSELAAAA